MRGHRTAKLLARAPGLRALPMMRLLAAGEILILARQHFMQLEPRERRRLVELVREGRGRASNLPAGEREELAELIAKANPRLFAGLAAQKLSPVRLPGRVVQGKRRTQRS